MKNRGKTIFWQNHFGLGCGRQQQKIRAIRESVATKLTEHL